MPTIISNIEDKKENFYNEADSDNESDFEIKYENRED